MGEIQLFKTPHKRPKRFSNPYDHFPDRQLEKILDKPDSNMDYSDYNEIFHLTPIGSYQECCYFLPFALRYIEENPDDVLDCLAEIIWFISNNIDNLKKDDLFKVIEGSLKMCLASWTKDFIVKHHDREACQKRQWSLDHDDMVENCQLLIECLDVMAEHRSFANIAFDFVAQISSSETNIQCAWYLELCNFNRKYNFIRNAKLKEVLADQKHINRCSDIIKKTSFMHQIASPTYWKDMRETLNLP